MYKAYGLSLVARFMCLFVLRVSMCGGFKGSRPRSSYILFLASQPPEEFIYIISCLTWLRGWERTTYNFLGLQNNIYELLGLLYTIKVVCFFWLKKFAN